MAEASVTRARFPTVERRSHVYWTGDKREIMPFIEPALRGLRWADKYLDADGDGFYAYSTRSEQGMKNQGWKDSGDAIVYEDGRQVPDPIATCEEQGFVYLAKLHLSELLWWLDEKAEARRLHDEAVTLKVVDLSAVAGLSTPAQRSDWCYA